jgi:tetratricopeptide (TPR) repeat protein
MKFKKLYFPVILFVTCFALYGNTLRSEYVFDDYIYTFNNQYIVKGFSAIKDIFDKGSLYGVTKDNSSQYRPLVLLDFMTEVSVFGLNPHVHHFFNVLFFAFTVVLLYFFLQKILPPKQIVLQEGEQTLWHGQAVIISATLLFAFHPIHTEAVASIKNRDEILGLLFGLLSFYFIMLNAEKSNQSLITYSLSLTTFSIAIFCKENCLTFAAIIPLLLYFFTDTELKKIIFKTIPFIGTAAFYLFIRYLVLDKMTFTNEIPVYSNSLMAATNNADMLATGFLLLGKYIIMTFIPYPLSWDYSYNQIPIVSWTNYKPIVTVIVCIIMLGIVLWGIKKKSIYSFLIAFFFITIFLSSNLAVKIAWTFGERFLYVPSLAFCIGLPVLLELWIKPKKFSYFYEIITFILIIYALILIPRNNVWENNHTLYESGMETAPDSYRPYRCMGLLYVFAPPKFADSVKKVKYYALAAQDLKKSVEICLRSDAFYNLGVCYQNEDKPDSAIMIYKKVITLNNEYYMDALRNIVDCYQKEKKYTYAFHYDSMVLAKVPDKKRVLSHMAVMHNEFGIQYAMHNEWDKAFHEFTTALQCDSNFANAICNIGVAYKNEGNKDMAKYYFTKALSKDPKNQVFAKDLESIK